MRVARDWPAGGFSWPVRQSALKCKCAWLVQSLANRLTIHKQASICDRGRNRIGISRSEEEEREEEEEEADPVGQRLFTTLLITSTVQNTHHRGH